MNIDNEHMQTLNTQTSRLEEEITQMPQIAKDRRFVEILFRSEEYRKVAEAQLELVTTQIEYRRQALKIFASSRIEELRQHCESEAQIRGYEFKLHTEQRTRKLISDREVWANQEVDNFLQNYEAAVERMEKIRVPKAKAKEQERLDQTLEAFYDTIDHFNQEFSRTLNFQADSSNDTDSPKSGRER